MNILITICARGGSKGIPGKNIRSINGIPLIGYTISHAKAFAAHYPCDIAVSTDDAEILKVAASFGIETDYVRPADLANDTAGKVPVIAALLQYQEDISNKTYDFVLDLDVSAPMRTTEDLLTGFRQLLQKPEAYNLFSVRKAHKNPYFNMVEEDKDGYFKLSKPLPAGVESRQMAPLVYEMNASFYFYRKSFFEDQVVSAISDKSLIFEMTHESFDLDEITDFDFLEYLITNKKLTFAI